MSGTTPSPSPSQAPTTAAPLATKPTSQAAANASSGAAMAGVVVLVWLLSLWHIALPPEVAAALVSVIGALVHYVTSLLQPTPPAS
jgi:hypothetical protein